jgi:hypothetical protein
MDKVQKLSSNEELDYKSGKKIVIFEIFAAVTMKNGVFWDVTPSGSCANRRFGET